MKSVKKRNKPTRFKDKFRRHVKLTFIPHGANQYRPHLTRRHGLIILLLLIIGVQAGYNVTNSGSVLGVGSAISTVELLNSTNDERRHHDLSLLKVDPRLSQAAYLKGQDMLRQQYWSHTAPNGTTPWRWFTEAGYNYASAGENLAKNFTSADATVAAWMASPDHRENLLASQYTDVGFAVVDGILQGKPVTLVVALYGEAADAATVAGVQANIEAAPPHEMGIFTRLGIGLLSLTPVAVGSLVVISVAVFVAFAAHVTRHKLPKRMRHSWYRHHGALKVGGMMSVMIIMVFLYSGGQV